MKKKLSMRIASLAVCIVFTGMLFGAPKSKAVVTETAVGTAAVASYFQATGLTLSCSAGATGALVTSGIADMAGSYAVATGAASSGSAWLSSLAAGCSISPAGLLVLSAAAVVAIGAFVAWYVSENGLEEEGDTVTVSLSDSVFLADGTSFPLFRNDFSESSWSQSRYFSFNTLYELANGNSFKVEHSEGAIGYAYFFDSSGVQLLKVSSVKDWRSLSGSFYTLNLNSSDMPCFWCMDNGVAYYIPLGLSSVQASYDLLGLSDVSLSVDCTSSFIQPDLDFAEDDTKEMQLDFGTPLTSLDDLSTSVPEQVANNTISVTYEIVDPAGEGVGDGEVTPDTGTDGETGIYIPILSDILNVLKGLADAILGGIQSLFTPTQAAIDALSAEIDTKLPLIPTLQDFGDELAYNLEHPEACADGLGLTTVVDLGKGRGSNLGNYRHDLLDVSWYLEYKPLVDDIIVGFCWLVFLWNCYGALPRIIHGEGSITGALSLIREEEGP